MMKLALISALAGSAAAFAPAATRSTSSALNAFSIDNMPGALPPMGFFDPLGFAEKADEKTLKRYREAEVTHGRVAMLAVIGFFVGEAVEGSSFLFDAQISGPAITHFTQVPDGWDALIVTFIGASEAQRAQKGWVDPADASYDQPGLLKDNYYPGDIGFDPNAPSLFFTTPYIKKSFLINNLILCLDFLIKKGFVIFFLIEILYIHIIICMQLF